MEMTVAAAGDAIIGTRISQHDHPADARFAGLCDLIRSADVASVNLETSLFDLDSFAGWPGAERGGSYLVGPPARADDLIGMGFDLFARANNHAGDWGIEGALATGTELDRRGIAHAGVGHNLAAAARPTYLDLPAGRVAMLSLTTTFPVSSKAGDQRPDISGRPGCNGVAIRRKLEVPAEVHRLLSGVLDDYGDPGLLERSNLGLVEGEGAIRETLDAADVERALTQIEKAAAFADLVLVNGHTHEPANHITEVPGWLEDFARRCIDAGAHAYLGHGPHQLRGVELYRERPIFYSLGNFIFHREVQDPIPAEQYTVFGLDTQRSSPHEYLAARDASRHRLSMTGSEYYEAVVPRLRFTDGILTEMSLHPIELSADAGVGARGTPRLAHPDHGEEILARLARLSSPYGMAWSTQDGIGHWTASE